MTSFALPKIFSPRVIIRDGRGCFGSRPADSDDPKSVSGTSQEPRSCRAGSRWGHANARPCQHANQATSRSCHADFRSCPSDSRSYHANFRSCHIDSRSCHANSRTCHANSLSRHHADSRSHHANFRTCHVDSWSRRINSRTCYGNSRSCHAHSDPILDLLDLTKSSDCRVCDEIGLKSQNEVSASRGGSQWYRERLQTNFDGHHYFTDSCKHERSSHAWERAGKLRSPQCPRDAADNEAVLGKDTQRERSDFSLQHDQKHRRCLQQTSWRESERQFDVTGSKSSPESVGDKVTCAGTWMPPQGPLPPPPPPPPPPPSSPTPPFSAPPHPPSPPIGGPPPLLFCPPTRKSFGTQTPCLTNETVSELNASRVSPSAHQRQRPTSTESLRITGTVDQETVNSVTKSCSSCEPCSLGRTVPNLSSDFSRALGYFNRNYDSVRTQTFSEALSRESQTNVASQHSNKPITSVTYVSERGQTQLCGTNACRKVSESVDHDLTQTGHRDEAYVEKSPRHCQKRETDHRYAVSPAPAVFCTSGSASVNGVDQQARVKRQSDHQDGREFLSRGPPTGRGEFPSGGLHAGRELPYGDPHAGRELPFAGKELPYRDLHTGRELPSRDPYAGRELSSRDSHAGRQLPYRDPHAGREFPPDGPDTPSRHVPQAPDILPNDKHVSPGCAPSVVEYRGIWTVIKANNFASYSAVHAFSAENKLQADFQCKDPGHAQNSFDVRHGRIGEACMTHEEGSDGTHVDSQNGVDIGLLRFGEELFRGKMYSSNGFLSTNCSSNVCSCLQRCCEEPYDLPTKCCEEPYDLSTKTVESTTKAKLAVTSECENNPSYSLSTDRHTCSTTFGRGAMHCRTYDLAINPCYQRHICDENGYQMSPATQKDKQTRNVSSVPPDGPNCSKRPTDRVPWMPPFPTSNSPLSQGPDVLRLPREISERSACGDLQNSMQYPSLIQLSRASQRWSCDTYLKDEHTRHSPLKDTWPSTFSQKQYTTETNKSDNVSQKTMTFCSSVVSQTQSMCTTSVPTHATTLCSDVAPDTARITSQYSQPVTAANNVADVATRAIHQSDPQPTTTETSTTTPATVPLCASTSTVPETADRGSTIPKPVTLSSTMAAQKDSRRQSIEATSPRQQQHGRPARKRRPRLRTFQCALCYVACSNRGQLKGHLRTHTGGHS